VANVITTIGPGKTACHCKNRIPAAKPRIELRISLQRSQPENFIVIPAKAGIQRVFSSQNGDKPMKNR
jgi:hypothetical protein